MLGRVGRGQPRASKTPHKTRLLGYGCELPGKPNKVDRNKSWVKPSRRSRPGMMGLMEGAK